MADMTVKAIESLKAKAKYEKYPVSRGLFIGVSSTGDKGFFVRYSIKGRQRDYRLPKAFGLKTNAASISLTDARALTAEIQALAKQGIDYQAQLEQAHKAREELSTKQKEANLTVCDLYDVWFSTLRRKDGGLTVTQYFKQRVLPFIGSMSLKELEEGHIRLLLKPIVAAGYNRTAEVVLDLLKQLFKWADGRKPWKLLVDNPVINLKSEDITSIGYVSTERKRFLSEQEIKILFAKTPSAQLEKQTEAVISITLSCCTRIGETVMSKWAEVDLINSIWHIPEQNTKGTSPAHTVYLSAFAVKQFITLKQYTGHSEWCFPNADDSSFKCPKLPTKQIRDRQVLDQVPLKNRSKLINSLTLSSERWTPHDLRRTGATTMQRLSVDQHIIERVQNHVEQNRVKRTYQLHDYADNLKQAWAVLGDYLDSLALLEEGPQDILE